MGANKLQVDEGEGKEAAEKLIEKQVNRHFLSKTDDFL